MNEKIIIALIAGAFGLFGGIVGSLIAPWVQWGIDKRRFRRDRRLKYIQDWRRYVGSNDFNPKTLPISRTYSTIRPYLSQSAIAAIENGSISVSVPGDDSIKRLLLDEITRIERVWELL